MNLKSGKITVMDGPFGESKEIVRPQARIAELRRRFVNGPVLLMPGGGGGMSDSRGAVVIPDVGTVYYGPYRMSGDWGTLEAGKGVLIASDGRLRRLPAPVPGDSATISGDGWTFKAAAGWVIREGARRGVLRSGPEAAVMRVNPSPTHTAFIREESDRPEPKPESAPSLPAHARLWLD